MTDLVSRFSDKRQLVKQMMSDLRDLSSNLIHREQKIVNSLCSEYYKIDNQNDKLLEFSKIMSQSYVLSLKSIYHASPSKTDSKDKELSNIFSELVKEHKKNEEFINKLCKMCNEINNFDLTIKKPEEPKIKCDHCDGDDINDCNCFDKCYVCGNRNYLCDCEDQTGKDSDQDGNN